MLPIVWFIYYIYVNVIKCQAYKFLNQSASKKVVNAISDGLVKKNRTWQLRATWKDVSSKNETNYAYSDYNLPREVLHNSKRPYLTKIADQRWIVKFMFSCDWTFFPSLKTKNCTICNLWRKFSRCDINTTANLFSLLFKTSYLKAIRNLWPDQTQSSCFSLEEINCFI